MSMYLSSIQRQYQDKEYIQHNFNSKLQKLTRQSSGQIYQDINLNTNQKSIHQSVNLQDGQNTQIQKSLVESQILTKPTSFDNLQNIRKFKQQRAFSQIFNQQNQFQNKQQFHKINEKLQVNNYIQNRQKSKNNSGNKNEKKQFYQEQTKSDDKTNSYRNKSNNKENVNCSNFQLHTQNQKVSLNKKIINQQIPVKQKQLKVFSKFISHAGLRKKIQKENQDSYIDKSNTLYGVYDGHGPRGELISQFISKNINQLYDNFREKYDIANSLFQSYKHLQKNLEKTSISNISGSTALTIKLDIGEKKIYVCNVGDSRVVMKLRDKVMSLSQDHKPSVYKEAERIKNLNGLIDCQYDQKGRPSGPLRVWSEQRETGLSMTRSLGDVMVKKFGVCWQPEICVYNLNGNEEYLIVASDGVWEFLSNQKCANLIQPFFESNDIDGACQKLYQESKDYWLKETNDQVVDDITVGIVFFKYI